MAPSKVSNVDFEEIPQELEFIERVTDVLDTKFRFKVLGKQLSFGIDPIIGLIPYFGEVFSFSISGLLVLSMIRHGASREVVIKMLFNLGFDALTGVVPVLGDIFDVFFKANRRNYRLLKEHQVDGDHQGKGWGLIIGALSVMLIMLGLMIWGMVAVIQWFSGLF